MRVALRLEQPFNVLVMDHHQTGEEVKEICAAIAAEKAVLARIEVVILLMDAVRKKQFTSLLGSLPVYVVTKPLTRTKYLFSSSFILSFSFSFSPFPSHPFLHTSLLHTSLLHTSLLSP
jgi:hypothetical protein